MRINVSVCLSFICLACVAGTAALADEVVLKNGSKIEGTVREDGKDVKIDIGVGTIILSQSEIRSIHKSDDFNREFDRRKQAIRPEDTTAYAELARWARQQGQQSTATALLREGLARDPNNEEIRHEMGYLRYKDAWLTPDEYKAALGLVRYQGEWVNAEAAEKLRRIDRDYELARARQVADDEHQDQQAALERDRLAIKNRWLDTLRTGGFIGDVAEAIGLPWGVRYWGPAVAATPLPNAQ